MWPSSEASIACVYVPSSKMHCCVGSPPVPIFIFCRVDLCSLAAAHGPCCSSSVRTRWNQREIRLWDLALSAGTAPCFLRLYQGARPVRAAAASSLPAFCSLEFPWWRPPQARRQISRCRAGPEPPLSEKCHPFSLQRSALGIISV